MDTNSIWTLLSSLGVSMAGAYWLARTLIQHRLARDLESHKLGLNRELELMRTDIQREAARDKTAMEGAIRREVESFLGQAAAQRQYEFDARRRLYLAIGPLRFQLLLACRDLAGRIEALGGREQYGVHLDGYYGKSTLYRLLRPVALAEAIEDQVALSDFAVDPSAVDCLRFRRSLSRILCGDELVEGLPGVNWNQQDQHLFTGSLSGCAQALIERREKEAPRVLRFDEFLVVLEREGFARVAPFDHLLQDFSAHAKPLLWLRLVAYAYACNALITRHGTDVGFAEQAFPTRELLQRSRQPDIMADAETLVARIEALALVPL